MGGQQGPPRRGSAGGDTRVSEDQVSTKNHRARFRISDLEKKKELQKKLLYKKKYEGQLEEKKRSTPKTKNSKRPKMDRENKFRVERSDDAADDTADVCDHDVNYGENQIMKNPNGTAAAATIRKRYTKIGIDETTSGPRSVIPP